MIIEFTREHDGINIPTRANPSDAGLDIYADLLETVAIEPGHNAMIPSGLRFGIPHGYMLQVCNRSSMGAKRSLVVGAHIIDSGYDGEVFIDLHNIGTETQTIKHKDKVAQVVMMPVIAFRISENKNSNLYSHGVSFSERGKGSLGSTDKKEEVHPLHNMPAGF